MPQRLDPIGVKAVWDSSDFIRGFRQYNDSLGRANRAGEQFVQQLERTGKSGSRSFQTFSRDTKKHLSSAGQSTRGYIATAKDLQATFQETSRLAAQFGGALRDAAAGQAVRQSFANLARASGVSADKLVANMKKASKGTVAELDLIRIANRAMLAGGAEFADELPRLFEIARAASVATGQDIGYVFDTLTRGIAKASPLLIDNAEIYIKVGQAVDSYAASVGKSADELTAQERQVATLNAVLAQGDQFIKRVGSDVEVATDKFDRWNAKVIDAKESTTSFLNDALGPMAPALREVGGLLSDMAPLLQTLILMKGAGGAGALGGLVSGLSGLVPILGGLALGVAGYEKIIRAIDQDLPPATKVLSDFSKMAQFDAIALTKGTHAAKEWLRAVEGIPTLAERTADAFAKHDEVLADVSSYDEYITRVMELNSQMEQGERLISLMTRAQFEYDNILNNSNLTLEQRIDLLNEVQQREGLGTLWKTAAAMGAELLTVVKNAQETKKAIEEVAAAEERAAAATVVMTGTLDAMSAALAKQKELERQRATELEGMEKEHQQKMADIARKGAMARADAQRELTRTLLDAERTRQQAIQQAAQAHARTVEDIEREHRRRLDDIENNYTRTVAEAALERDALAILRARERRADEIADAEQDRQEQMSDEGRNFQERQQQIEQSYRDQVNAAQAAYQERLADIDRALAEEERKERESQQKRQAQQRQADRQELQEARQKYRQLEVDLMQHLIRMNQITSQYGRRGGMTKPGGVGGTTPMQHGFDGVVTGPRTFQVEPGVTEYVYASGNLGQRQPVLPSAAVTQMQSTQAMVSGAVNVGMRGFSDGLVGRIAEPLKLMVGQAVIDQVTDEFEALLQ